MSSSGSIGSGGTSPPGSGSESLSPGFLDQSAFMKKFFGAADHNQQSSISTSSSSSSSTTITTTATANTSISQHPNYHNHHHHHHFHHENIGRRERRGSGSIFTRRQDYSSFNNLPRHKINSYHIKMEEDHGNDDTRNFILSTLSANRMNRISCIMCHTSMMIFDKYPLIDGTFFLSPTQHSKGAVPTTVENGSKQYLNAVCMGCLEGWNSIVKCRSCSSRWTGSHLILGSMYSYDIFAAVPCCTDRLRCNNCKNLVISPDHRLQFFSHYSNSIACGHCGIVDFHFAKPLQVNFIRTGRE
ncbi:headcase protein-like [Panonychus citri]|uniref:headcase protein-like n=1 Tax=Panonychus citri TaxID=50023 RepID=UPI0023080940|nr:headcase protein-like [Panonychus citri]